MTTNLSTPDDRQSPVEPGPDDNTDSAVPIRSFARSNQELFEAFETYLISLDRSEATRRAYLNSVGRLIEVLGPKDAADLDRSDIRKLQCQLLAKGITANSIRSHTCGIRAWTKFLRLAGVTRHDPSLLLSNRKLPSRIPRVLKVEEIDRLIAACKTPLERAVVETMYSTGVRISELVALRVEDVTFSEPGVIRVIRSKGDKSRIVLFGKKATVAIKEYLNGRTTGFLFEAPARIGCVTSNRGSWCGLFCIDGIQRQIRFGKIDSMTASEVRQMLTDTLAKTPGFHPRPAGAYNARSIRLLLSRVAIRAKVAGVHPHALRRAFATHMLEGGANLRVIQELLGHDVLSTTMLYTNLSGSDLKRIHDRCHPHAKRRITHGKEKK
jgi:site-specific recombinase XerD